MVTSDGMIEYVSMEDYRLLGGYEFLVLELC